MESCCVLHHCSNARSCFVHVLGASLEDFETLQAMDYFVSMVVIPLHLAFAERVLMPFGQVSYFCFDGTDWLGHHMRPVYMGTETR